MGFENMMRFQGTWRTYQARVLERAGKYAMDKHLHIVAAPGSGKTTLGIELINRFGKPTLILAPSVTIREQWESRIVDAFLKEGIRPEDVISQDLKNPKTITIATYQALHSAMTRYKGALEEFEEEENADKTKAEVSDLEAEPVVEQVDFSGFDLVQTMKDQGLGCLCLDECHHLRSEWWKALEDFRSQMGEPYVIALTATPPYDSNPAMWQRYMNMCGEIDEEITIPELVKEGSLCPHQDFIYFNYPTEEELKVLNEFEEKAKAMYDALLSDADLMEAVNKHPFLIVTEDYDQILEDPEYLSALLVYMNAKSMVIPSHLRKLLGERSLPAMDYGWMEVLLQNVIYNHPDHFAFSEEKAEELQDSLKKGGFIDKRKVQLSASEKVEKLLMNSKGKCKSIVSIVDEEYGLLQENLRMLVLTDYIRKEHEKSLGSGEETAPSLGVLPFFEMLRKHFADGDKKARLAVLCGTIVIIPAEAKDALLEVVPDPAKVSFSKAGMLSEEDYVKVNAIGDAHFLTGAVTELFTKGCFQIIIGTKSLLGEGWDSPCINSLILASFVGSYMLSNQMRGRAIRVFKGDPNKTSNIWHLVCVKPTGSTAASVNGAKTGTAWNGTAWNGSAGRGSSSASESEDFALMERRMEHFLGLHYTENVIESGIGRLTAIRMPFTKENVEKTNAEMIAQARRRESLKDRWNQALIHSKKMEIAEATETEAERVPKATFDKAVKTAALSTAALVTLTACQAAPGLALLSGLIGVGQVASSAGLLTGLIQGIRNKSSNRRLKQVGTGMVKAMKKYDLLEDRRVEVVAISDGKKDSIYLKGGTGRDKTNFANYMKELMAPVDNQRYLLVRGNGYGKNAFYSVPDVFAKNKENASDFAEFMTPYLGKRNLVYTRNEEGRKVLLRGKKNAFAMGSEKGTTKRFLI